MGGVGLATYQACTFAEKRDVLRIFWSRRDEGSDKVRDAAREYGPYALVMVAVITVELAIITAALLTDANAWAWLAAPLTLLGALSTWWTGVCHHSLRRRGDSSRS